MQVSINIRIASILVIGACIDIAMHHLASLMSQFFLNAPKRDEASFHANILRSSLILIRDTGIFISLFLIRTLVTDTYLPVQKFTVNCSTACPIFMVRSV